MSSPGFEGVSTSVADPIVQYIAVRSDLKWAKGALVAQACHAALAVTHLNYDDHDTMAYLHDLDHMHKIVIGVPSESELVKLADELNKNGIKNKLWYEQPENLPTSLALKPYKKSMVEQFFKAFKLLR